MFQENQNNLEAHEKQPEAQGAEQDWEKKAQEYLDGWKRAKADYLNFKKETQDRQKEFAQFAIAGTALKLVPIVENFEQAFRHIPENAKDSEWVRGMSHIKKQMEDVLKDFGLERIPTVGKKFDPNMHEASAMEKKDGFEPDVIFEEVMAGYMIDGKTLLPAKVKVAK